MWAKLPLLSYKSIFYSCACGWFRGFLMIYWITVSAVRMWNTPVWRRKPHMDLPEFECCCYRMIKWRHLDCNQPEQQLKSLSLSASFKCCLQMLYIIKYFKRPDPFYLIRHVRFWWIVGVLKTRLVYFPSANYKCDYRPDWFEQIIDTTDGSFCQPTNNPCSW